MVTPIETKQELVQSNHRRGSYRNGMRAACLVQLAHLASRTASVGPTRPFGELDGLLIPILPFGGLDVGVSLYGIRCPRPRATFLEDLSCESFSDLLRNLT
ncbi:hypothetical protein F2Q69_00006003 [Brassica cretica]|uniref:Uncharacterized protein n=1 Tax=Brassica cretica TaxID=69181 RepID=A0A8S9PGJ8_BRACR|nr:hypothetical protein F2Q69_00006003 [Brassica cretica]